MGLRPLTELIRVYHQTVGRSCRLEMDMSPDQSGLIPPAHAARYAQLGGFIRACYGGPLPASLSHPSPSLWVADFPVPTTVDRVQLMEDQTAGQVIRAYTVETFVQGGGASHWVQVTGGTSIGQKKIDLFAAPITTTALRFNVTRMADEPVMRSFQAFLCDTITANAVRASEALERATVLSE